MNGDEIPDVLSRAIEFLLKGDIDGARSALGSIDYKGLVSGRLAALKKRRDVRNEPRAPGLFSTRRDVQSRESDHRLLPVQRYQEHDPRKRFGSACSGNRGEGLGRVESLPLESRSRGDYGLPVAVPGTVEAPGADRPIYRQGAAGFSEVTFSDLPMAHLASG
jgi:hypothetical protein